MQTHSSTPTLASSVKPSCARAAGNRRTIFPVLCSSTHRPAERPVPDHSACSYTRQDNHTDSRHAGHILCFNRARNGKDASPAAHAASSSQNTALPLEAPLTDHLPFSLHQLHAFKTVVATGSKQQTADILGVTGTNVSLMLNKLEKDFDEQLLIRSKGAPVQLTPAGQLLLRYTERMLSLCNDALSAAKDVQDIKTGTMTIGASQTTGVYLMPHLIEKFRRHHSQVGIHLVVENTRRCCQAVSRGELDFAVVGGKIPTDLQHLLVVTPYQEDEVVLVCSKEHPLCGHQYVTKEELRELKYVSLFQSSTVGAIKNTLTEHHIQWQSLQVVLEVNSVEAIKSSVACNLGVAFVSKLAIEQEVKAGQLHAMEVEGIPLTRSLRCVADPARYQSRAVQAFIDIMFDPSAYLPEQAPTPLEAEEVGCCSGKKVHTVERYPGLGARGPLPSDLSHQKWGMQPRGQSDSGHHTNASSIHKQQMQAGQQALATSVIVAPEVKVPFSLAQVAVFLAVARTGSPTSASLACCISQPAVSKSLSGLEQALGGRLVFKTLRSGPALLTEAGQAVLPYCQQLVEVAGEASKAMQDFRLASTGVVSLGASQTVGTYIMPRLVAAFKKSNPEVVVQLAVDKSRSVCLSVANGEVDVAIIGGHVPEDLKDVLQAVPYAQDELVLLVPSSHELAQRGSIEKCELYNLDFVSMNQGSSVQAAQEETLLQQGIKWHKLHTHMELNSVEAIKGAVQHGLGVAFVSVTAIQKELDLGLASRVSINGVRLFRTLRLVSNPRRDYSRIAQKFMVDVFGMASMDSFIGQRQGNGEKGAAPLPHVTPAARPWEHVPGANGAPVPKPILQQAQNLNGTSALKTHQPRSSG
ncbi:TPA: hypothetical protein ACH3X1_012948 [Trebouxia sp. C0004]